MFLVYTMGLTVSCLPQDVQRSPDFTKVKCPIEAHVNLEEK